MLQIRDISKEYRTGDLVQKALDHVSLNLRDNEFVAILGPSGSGKTTLLNIIGGLDRYDSGDLIINGVSTKKYKNRDWDAYRNHTIGFVFQSYNLISHQTVLSNVELALTISGVSGAERHDRAMEALRMVGLAEQAHKKPNQLSGGQMQRVAIARALVNDPDIVLADEPTGALDTETSVQVMDILKEVAKDRLVVMVTHNPELANEYANRIVRIKDGQIRSDSNPVRPDELDDKPPVHKRIGKASMSFLTALALSGNNLRTKKARTILVSFAGSIGIIGIALILALSNGANVYIQTQEAETLSQYPLEIQKTGYDLAAIMGSMSGSGSGNMMGGMKSEDAVTDGIGVENVADQLFTQTSNNDLSALKKYLDSGESDIEDYTKAIEYTYDITPQIYTYDGDKAKQLNPNRMFSDLSTGDMNITGMMSSSLSIGFFSELPQSTALYEDQYDLKAGSWPKGENDLLLVLNSDGKVSDVMLYALGLRDTKELEQRVKDFADGKKTENSDSTSGSDDDQQIYSYDDFLGRTFRVVPASSFYTYDDTYGVWTDRRSDDAFVKDLVANGKELKITGIVQPKEDAITQVLSSGISYTAQLERDLMKEAADSEVVKAQLADKDVNVLTGKKFSEEDVSSDMDLSKLFSIDESALEDAFQVNAADLSSISLDPEAMFSGLDFSNLDLSSLDLSSSIDPEALQEAMGSMDSLDLDQLLSKVKLNVTQDQLTKLFGDVTKGYLTSAAKDPSTDYANLAGAFVSYLGSQDARKVLQEQLQAILNANAQNLITVDDAKQMIQQIFEVYARYATEKNLENPLTMESFNTWLNDKTAGAQETIKSSLSIITDKLNKFTITSDQTSALASALMKSYDAYAAANKAPQLDKAASSFLTYLQSPEAQKILGDAAANMIDLSDVQQSLNNTMTNMMASLTTAISEQVGQAMSTAMESMSGQITDALSQAMEQTIGQISGSMENMFQIDPDQLAKAFQANMDPSQLQELLSSMMTGSSSSYESNLSDFGYASEDNPTSIRIYPNNFAAKNAVVDILNEYNDRMKASGQDSKAITYTDMVATMMSSVTQIIDTISYILIAFVAISLIVSSIMIGVITYISVLERRKEIGILRALGASKHNVAQVFNAETFITGLLAGLIGIGLTLILEFPLNYGIQAVTGQTGIKASLPPVAAGILILLSIFLTVIAGLIPSRKASKSDPVAALRGE